MSEQLVSFISRRAMKLLMFFLMLMVLFITCTSRWYGVSEHRFFGTQVGFLEFFVCQMFFASAFLALAIDGKQRDSRERQEEFHDCADQINEWRKFLKNKAENLSDELAAAHILMSGTFKITCPDIDLEEKAYREGWAILLDELYRCSRGKSLKRARERSKSLMEAYNQEVPQQDKRPIWEEQNRCV